MQRPSPRLTRPSPGDEQIKTIVAGREQRIRALLAHLVREKKHPVANLKALDGKELNGFGIAAEGNVKVGAAEIVTADVKRNNGIVRVIDTALILR